MLSQISFVLDGRIVSIPFTAGSGITPTTTVLNYLRSLPGHKGVKEGCAEGDCGACTVVVAAPGPDGAFRYNAVDSCLVFLPMLHGKHLITVENLKTSLGELHPVQKSMVDLHGSQCGFCTPGIIMSLFSLYHNHVNPSRETIADSIAGNLCRCTGYKPILDAAARACSLQQKDHFSYEEPRISAMLKTISNESIAITAAGQTYRRPATLAEALKIKAEHPGAVVINGGTDIALRVTKKFETIPDILDLSGITELNGISEEDDALIAGASTTINMLLAASRTSHPALHAMLSVFGANQVRNMATIGGNIGTASPISDTLPVLLAYDARIVLQSLEGKRIVNARDFFKGYRLTERREQELIVRIILPKPPVSAIIRSYKVSKRKDLDISTLSAGFRLELDDQRRVRSIVLAYGGMAERVKRAQQTEAFLAGKPWTRAIVEEAMAAVDNDFTPISDARAGAEMRRIAARNLLLKFWSDSGTNGVH